MVLGLLTDLIFSSKIAQTCKDAGVSFTRVRSLAEATNKLAEQQVMLFICDLTLPGLDLTALAAVLKSCERPARSVGYLPHVEEALRERALATGLQEVLPRSRFVHELSGLIASCALK